jgi:UDP:flavonoid glycosyltransferase YjiC (YdhE family)
VRAIVDELAPTFFAASYWVAKDVLRARRPDAVIGSNLSYGLFWAAAERRVPAVMIAATQISWITRRAPLQCLDFAIPERLLPYAIGAIRGVAVGLADHWLRSLARTVGATSFDPSLTATEREVALHLGMWPELVRPRSDGDAPNTRACGFARAGHLGTAAPALSGELEAFLSAGSPPVVIALGSVYSLGSDDLVADAADACADLGKRCVIVGPAPRDRALPGGTYAVPYATYHLLFPRAAAVITHGGAGTTGETLKCGRPSVVCPLAFDQFGLAWQVEGLGTGVRVRKKGRSRATIQDALRIVCEDQTMQSRAEKIAAELRQARDGAAVAADLIVGLATSQAQRA